MVGLCRFVRLVERWEVEPQRCVGLGGGGGEALISGGREDCEGGSLVLVDGEMGW